MARTYRRKSKRGSLKMDYITAAVRRVKDGDAIRKVQFAKEMNIDGSTLSRYVKKTAVGRLGILVTGATAEFFWRWKNQY